LTGRSCNNGWLFVAAEFTSKAAFVLILAGLFQGFSAP